ncbi:MAG: hypothetical protein ACD_10C00561G0001 [uncultured bacterium]|nr:MAG: hypothetical protein ACD_10C00561G0001 [uncultured bacterium]
MGIFLGAHDARHATIRVEQHGGLLNLAAFLNFVDLPLNFVIDGLLEETEGIEILDFAPRSQLVLPSGADGNIGIAAERAFLHIAIANADPAHQRVQHPGVGDRLFR